jgi:hypothetical protein
VTNSIGPITPLDEQFCHQVVDTFAVVGNSDPSWTEKVCAMAAARDGNLQIGFGLGKYPNRNVIDAYAGISRGVEQITVRASRELTSAPTESVIGPIRYEILEPLKSVRFVLEPNDVQPIAFDCVFQGALPPTFEDRTHIRTGLRVSAELVRYHQIGVCSGWVEVDGVRTDMTPTSWVSTRDHSWGVRYGIGEPPRDTQPSHPLENFHFFWTPSYLERPDGTPYGIFMVFSQSAGTGFEAREAFGRIEHPDGRQEAMVEITPELTYDEVNRRLRGGKVHCRMRDGSTRTLLVDVVSDTGFHLGTGLYFGFDGHYHGEWRGPQHVDGERIADCSTPESARRVHQIRDTVVRITDPVGGGAGWGNWQPVVYGEFPELGLSGATSFL